LFIQHEPARELRHTGTFLDGLVNVLFVLQEFVMRTWKNHTKTSMFGKLIFAAAFVLGSLALATPVLAAGQHHGELRGNGFSHPRDGVPRGIGFAGPRGISADQFSHNHSGYDGDRYWSDDNCFPTEPGGCG